MHIPVRLWAPRVPTRPRLPHGSINPAVFDSAACVGKRRYVPLQTAIRGSHPVAGSVAGLQSGSRGGTFSALYSRAQATGDIYRGCLDVRCIPSESSLLMCGALGGYGTLIRGTSSSDSSNPRPHVAFSINPPATPTAINIIQRAQNENITSQPSIQHTNENLSTLLPLCTAREFHGLTILALDPVSFPGSHLFWWPTISGRSCTGCADFQVVSVPVTRHLSRSGGQLLCDPEERLPCQHRLLRQPPAAKSCL